MAKKKKKPKIEHETKSFMLRVIVVPASGVFVIFTSGGVIGTLLDFSMVNTYLLGGVGVILFLTYYFRKELGRFVFGR